MPKNYIIKDVTERYIQTKTGLERLGAEDVKVYKMSECHIIYSKENGKLHMSISTEYRLPKWDEVKFARYELMPKDIHVAMILPPPSEYVNVHEYCFHLWEVDKQDHSFHI